VPVQRCLGREGLDLAHERPLGQPVLVHGAVGGQRQGGRVVGPDDHQLVASSPLLLASKVTVPAGTSALAGSTDHS
jgi:hypothetical protein